MIPHLCLTRLRDRDTIRPVRFHQSVQRGMLRDDTKHANASLTKTGIQSHSTLSRTFAATIFTLRQVKQASKVTQASKAFKRKIQDINMNNSMNEAPSNNNNSSFTTPSKYQTHSIAENDHCHGNGLVNVVSFDADDLPVAHHTPPPRTLTGNRIQVVTPATLGQLARDNYTRQDALADMHIVIDQTDMFQQKLASVGLQVSADAIFTAVHDSHQSRQHLMFSEFQEVRRMQSMERQCAQNRVDAERRHKEQAQAAREDKDWLDKIKEARAKTFEGIADQLVVMIGVQMLTRVVIGMYRGNNGFNAEGALHGFNGYLSNQCKEGLLFGYLKQYLPWLSSAPVTKEVVAAATYRTWYSSVHQVLKTYMPSLSSAPVTEEVVAAATTDTWYSFMHQLLMASGPTFVYEQAKSFTVSMVIPAWWSVYGWGAAVFGGVTSTPCYAVHSVWCLLGTVLAYRVLTGTKNCSWQTKLVSYSTLAIFFSGLPWINLGACAVGIVLLAGSVAMAYCKFKTKHIGGKTPATEEVTGIKIAMESEANRGWLFMLASIFVYGTHLGFT
ncbi:hypothetical protein MPSEU_000961400 [Mayamaea pseudoterrestris]|nr:hypothetical protein MPSEU_000961400 [Mayamaea pseudoterrestris]